MTISRIALASVVQHCGLRRCPGCITPAQRMCADPLALCAAAELLTHMATGVCHYCEPLWDALGEHADECPAVAIARLSATCKAIACERNPAEVAEHVAARADRKAQFQDEPVMPDFDDFGDFGYYSD